MKKNWKIMLAIACMAMLSTLIVLAVSANASEVKLDSVQVATGGSVKMNFIYGSLEGADKIIVEVAGNTTEIPVANVPTNDAGKYVVTVPLAPSQMADEVKVVVSNAYGSTLNEKVYSVREYAMAILSSPTYSDYHASMRGLLNWGAMADKNFCGGVNADKINGDIYSGRRNPVHGLVSFFSGEGEISDNSVIDVVGYELFLEEGNTAMEFFFVYSGEDKLSAIIERDGVQVGTATPIKGENGIYAVRISNVGVAVFDKTYTVTITDGTSSASVSKTVLEYLNTIAFDDKYDEAQRNLAKSMYQFYVQAMNVKIEGCEHQNGTHKTLDSGEGCEIVYCSNCFEIYKQIDHNIVDNICTVCGHSNSDYKEDTEWIGPVIGGSNVSTKPGTSVDVGGKFDLDKYMAPIWNTEIIHNETVMFLWDETEAPLLYHADEIVSVRSYDLKTIYEEGVDYKLEDGKLIRLEGSRMPCADESMYYTHSGSSMTGYTTLNGEVVPLYAGDNVLKKWQVAVTYTHSDEWQGTELRSYGDEQYSRFVEKLENGEDVTIFFYGDSITVGANASGLADKPPYTPTWSKMFCQYLAKQYGYTVEYISLDYTKASGGSDVYGTRGTIRYINTAMGGETSAGGINNFSSRNDNFIAQYGCDLAVIAYGMNDVGATAAQHAANMETLANKFISKASNTDILFIATMEPNPDLVPNVGESSCANSTQRTFEPALIELAEKINGNGTNCAVAPMTSMSIYINQESKRFQDSTGNNLNHPNDFLVRVYAQTVFETVVGYTD